jgi:hypothetical protein
MDFGDAQMLRASPCSGFGGERTAASASKRLLLAFLTYEGAYASGAQPQRA